ncbi:hypothetical protein PAGU2595_015950 [Lysobacter xanthus]
MRGSRLLAGVLASLGVFGACGLFVSDLDGIVAAALSPLVVGWGALLAGQELRKPVRELVFRPDGSVRLDGTVLDDVHVAGQGPLTLLRWRDAGRTEHVVAWPDVVDAGRRRELRLWAAGYRADASTAAVAP